MCLFASEMHIFFLSICYKFVSSDQEDHNDIVIKVVCHSGKRGSIFIF